MTSQVYLAFFLPFVCCVGTMSGVEDNIQTKNGGKFSHQNGLLNTYEIILKQFHF